jgi:hypothetical protein
MSVIPATRTHTSDEEDAHIRRRNGCRTGCTTQRY